MPSTIKKLSFVITLFVALGGCQGVYLQSPDSRPVQKPKIDPDDLPALIEDASYLGKECDSDEPSRVVQPKVWYASCQMGLWTMVDKAVLESRVIQYRTPRATLLSISPLPQGKEATDGKCIYTIEYATEYMEREFIDSTVKVDYTFELHLTVNQDKPATTASDCKIQDGDSAYAAIQQNWNIDETTHKILGEKRPAIGVMTPPPAPPQATPPKEQVTHAKTNVSRSARPSPSKPDLERERLKNSAPGI
ncbi:hypothetical protein [Pseudomonas serbica]|uniref:hypothetical protein n=1 Tax=Pseudomonas serbica TaxID=2965074 RepID=UPI00237BCB40|nr:hypothetical protein [Pseudomonas serbica]